MPPRLIPILETPISMEAENALKREILTFRAEIEDLKEQNAKTQDILWNTQSELDSLQDHLDNLMMNLEKVQRQEDQVREGKMWITDESRICLKMKEKLQLVKAHRLLYEENRKVIDIKRKMIMDRICILNRTEYKRVFEILSQEEREQVAIKKRKIENERDPLHLRRRARARNIMDFFLGRMGIEATTVAHMELCEDEPPETFYFIFKERWLVEICVYIINIFEWSEKKKGWVITYSAPEKYETIADLQFSKGVLSCINHLKRKVQKLEC